MRVSYAPPTGHPLGTNLTFKICTKIAIPFIKAITKRTWVGGENIPKSGAVIVANNHLSYFDVLNFAHFLFANGYNRDWYGFDYGALIGSFDGVNWFAVGNQRRIQAKSNKLYLALNAYFGDLTINNTFN